jgi:hypothetical protein
MQCGSLSQPNKLVVEWLARMREAYEHALAREPR